MHGARSREQPPPLPSSGSSSANLMILALNARPLFKFRNNAQLAAQLAASISHVALI
jgi:hypothetical protein